jgi:hypothetical protein
MICRNQPLSMSPLHSQKLLTVGTFVSFNKRIMVEVFITDVELVEESQILVNRLLQVLPESEINFDLEDCDRILRIKADTVCNGTVIDLLNRFGYRCEVLV